jgi:hypothetical protein
MSLLVSLSLLTITNTSTAIMFADQQSPRSSIFAKYQSSKDTISLAFPSCEKTKAQAFCGVEVYIKEQEKKMGDMDKLIVHNERLKLARQGSKNNFGVMLSTRQIQKFENKKEDHIRTIKNLQSLLDEIDSSDFCFDYDEKALEIVAPEMVALKMTSSSEQNLLRRSSCM